MTSRDDGVGVVNNSGDNDDDDGDNDDNDDDDTSIAPSTSTLSRIGAHLRMHRNWW